MTADISTHANRVSNQKAWGAKGTIKMSPMKPIFSVKELVAAESIGPKGAAWIVRVNSSMVVKTGYSVRAAEAKAMELVRARTSVPVPEIYNVYEGEDGQTRIVMEFIEGRTLEQAWDELTEDERRSVREQLAHYLSEIRSIRGDYIGSLDRSPCIDQMFTDDELGYGPFESEPAFNSGIIRALKSSRQDVWVDIVSDMITENLRGHDIVLTHSDFAPRNIIVRGSQVVSILDWELSGFYPEYWEYVKALYRPDWGSGWIKERNVEKIMKPYNVELAILMHTREIVW